jgi:hypothetical protein
MVFRFFDGKAQTNDTVTSSDLSRWCHFLAGDDMKGRRNGSPEMKLAGEYIAAHFRESGLAPAPGDTGYFQDYSFSGRGNRKVEELNVIGIIEGSDPVLKNEWIILSAHFDHVGTGRPVNGDSIFNGADDNAAGTVTLMGLARLLGLTENRPARSILFAAFSGEEMGLRGSKYFFENSPIPVDKIKLNLNFEMTGEFKTLGEKLFIITGYKFTDFDDLVRKYKHPVQWQPATQMKSPDWVFFASDNATFAFNRTADSMTLNIPAFTIVTTDDLTIIHKVTDEPEALDYENMASLVDYLDGLIRFLAADPLDIKWDEEAFRRAQER